MELDRQRITIRERGYVDILDLALRVIREFGWPLIGTFCLGVAPMLVLNQWLLSGYESDSLDSEASIQQVIWMLMLIIFEAPLATAPATLYLGQSMFQEHARLREVLKSFRDSLTQLVLYQIFLRPLCFRWTYLNEVILLDRNPIRRKSPQGRSTWSRARTVHRGEGGDLFGRAFVSFGVGLLLFVAIWASLNALSTLFAGRLEWSQAMETFCLPLSLWIVICYFAVVRFLGYLDLRIRREGWELELAMRAERAKLTRH
jgi:hypothetical protein